MDEKCLGEKSVIFRWRHRGLDKIVSTFPLKQTRRKSVSTEPLIGLLALVVGNSWHKKQQINYLISYLGIYPKRLKTTQKFWVFHRFTTPKTNVHLLNYFRKAIVITDIFMETLLITCFISVARLFEQNHECFGNVKNRLPPNIPQVHATYFKNALLSSECEGVFAGSLAQSVRELWPITTSQCTIAPSAGLKSDICWKSTDL